MRVVGWAISALVLAVAVAGVAALLGSESQAVAAQSRLQPLSEQEKTDLLHMREEEKLARDVYMAMYDLWGSKVFSNIVASEQTHMDSVATLLARYNLPDPVAGMAPGEFATEYFQGLYAGLVAMGSQSLAEAMTVGCIIEEIDILDLLEYAGQTTHQDIKRVYQNLEAGSENHLQAFVGQLAALGITYEPQYLTDGQYQQIVNP